MRNIALNMMIKNETMKTLTIEHLSAYLPYGLKFISGHYLVGLYGGGSDITRPILLSETMSGQIDWEANMDMDKPLLRPLSQLTETIEHNGERFVPIEKLSCMYEFELSNLYHIRMYIDQGWTTRMTELPYDMFSELVKWHFDTFGLIEDSLAMPIQSIPQP